LLTADRIDLRKATTKVGPYLAISEVGQVFDLIRGPRMVTVTNGQVKDLTYISIPRNFAALRHAIAS
jgi:hypothetical protein